MVLTFTMPQWQRPAELPLTMLARAYCGRGIDASSNGCSSSMSSGVSCRFGKVALAFTSITTAFSPKIGGRDPTQQQPIRSSRRRPRAGGALGTSVGDNAPDGPGGSNLSRQYESESQKAELMLRLKDMGRRFEWRGALKVFERAQAEGLVMDNNVYSCIIAVVAKSGRWSEAVELLEEARDGREPNKHCFTAAISACARGRNWRLALSLLDQMREAGLAPDHVTYGAAVSAMARTRQWQRAMDLLRQMEREGLRPNVVCYGAAVDACAKGGQWEMAVDLLEEMKGAGVMPDRICYNTAINACSQSGEWEIALSLAEKMRRAARVLGKKAGPDSVTFNSIMNGMAGAGEWERLMSVLRNMRKEGVAPDVVSYNTAMAACNKARRYQRALSTFEDMQAAGVTPDHETYSAAAEAYAGIVTTNVDRGVSGGNIGDLALELIRRSRNEGQRRPRAKAVAATLVACLEVGSWQSALPAVEGMLTASGTRSWDDALLFLSEARSLFLASSRSGEGKGKVGPVGEGRAAGVAAGGSADDGSDDDPEAGGAGEESRESLPTAAGVRRAVAGRGKEEGGFGYGAGGGGIETAATATVDREAVEILLPLLPRLDGSNGSGSGTRGIGVGGQNRSEGRRATVRPRGSNRQSTAPSAAAIASTRLKGRRVPREAASSGSGNTRGSSQTGVRGWREDGEDDYWPRSSNGKTEKPARGAVTAAAASLKLGEELAAAAADKDS